MFGMFIDSARLFFRGKLFRDNRRVIRMWLLGFVGSTALVVLLVLVLDVWIGAAIGGLLGGALMPYLFRDLKYA